MTVAAPLWSYALTCPAGCDQRHHPSTSKESNQLGNQTRALRTHEVANATLHTATDIDFYSFSARKSGTIRISASFDGGADSLLTVFDATGVVVASSSTGSVSAALASGAERSVSIESPSGAIDAYDLVFEKVGGGGKGGGPKGGKGKSLEPDSHFADEATRDLFEKAIAYTVVDDPPAMGLADLHAPFVLPGPAPMDTHAAALDHTVSDLALWSLGVAPTRTPAEAPSEDFASPHDSDPDDEALDDSEWRAALGQLLGHWDPIV